MIGKTPFGFGSSSPRFPKERKDSTPGPGSYDPKPLTKQVRGGTFSKAERFDVRKQVNVGEIATPRFKERLISSIKSKIQDQIGQVALFRSEPYRSRLDALDRQLNELQKSQQAQSKDEFVKDINLKLKNCFKDSHFSIAKPQKKDDLFIVKENRDYPESFNYSPEDLEHIRDHYGELALSDTELKEKYELEVEDERCRERLYFAKSINFGIESPIGAGYRDGKPTIGVVSITKAADFTAPRWRQVMEEIRDAGYEEVILDLRHVPGGSSELVQYGLPYFCDFEPGTELVSSRGISKAANVDEKLKFRGRVTVLIDDKTMSNAETTASVAKKSGLEVVGTPTAGMWMWGNYGNPQDLGLEGMSIQIPTGPILTLGSHFGPPGADRGDFSRQPGVIPEDQSLTTVEAIIQRKFPNETFVDNQLMKLSDDTSDRDKDNHQLRLRTGVFSDPKWLDRP